MIRFTIDDELRRFECPHCLEVIVVFSDVVGNIVVTNDAGYLHCIDCDGIKNEYRDWAAKIRETALAYDEQLLSMVGG